MTQRLAFTDITVMAGQAVTGVCRAVIKRHVSKGGSNMTVAAILSIRNSHYVIREFTDADQIIVTCITAAGNTAMIICTRAEGARSMTRTTVIIGWYMLIESRCKWFARRFSRKSSVTT